MPGYLFVMTVAPFTEMSIKLLAIHSMSANRRGMCVTTSRGAAGNAYCSTAEQRKLERILARISRYSKCNILVHIIQEICVSAGCITILNTSENPSAKRSMPPREAQLQGAGRTIVFLNKVKKGFLMTTDK